MALAILLAAAAQAPGRGGLPASLKAAKQKDGLFKTEVRVNIPIGDAKVVWFRAKSMADKAQQFAFKDDGSSSELEGYKVRWFKGHQNVSSDVYTEGHLFVLDPGESKFFQAKVKHTGPGDPICIVGELYDRACRRRTRSPGSTRTATPEPPWVKRPPPGSRPVWTSQYCSSSSARPVPRASGATSPSGCASAPASTEPSRSTSPTCARSTCPCSTSPSTPRSRNTSTTTPRPGPSASRSPTPSSSSTPNTTTA